MHTRNSTAGDERNRGAQQTSPQQRRDTADGMMGERGMGGMMDRDGTRGMMGGGGMMGMMDMMDMMDGMSCDMRTG